VGNYIVVLPVYLISHCVGGSGQLELWTISVCDTLSESDAAKDDFRRCICHTHVGHHLIPAKCDASGIFCPSSCDSSGKTDKQRCGRRSCDSKVSE